MGTNKRTKNIHDIKKNEQKTTTKIAATFKYVRCFHYIWMWNPPIPTFSNLFAYWRIRTWINWAWFCDPFIFGLYYISTTKIASEWNFFLHSSSHICVFFFSSAFSFLKKYIFISLSLHSLRWILAEWIASFRNNKFRQTQVKKTYDELRWWTSTCLTMTL